MGTTSLVLEAIRNLGGKARPFEICDYIAKKEGKRELTRVEKHHVGAAIYHLKRSKRLAYHGAATYVLWPDA
jgi:hypothetical protein